MEYHGPTLAFKDMALQPFGALLKSIAKSRNEKFLIMCATSGDTGPATLEAFADDENIKAVCLYPQGGTSEIQRQQMVKQSAANLKILGVRGNFDDTQRALKSLLADDDFRNELSHVQRRPPTGGTGSPSPRAMTPRNRIPGGCDRDERGAAGRATGRPGCCRRC